MFKEPWKEWEEDVAERIGGALVKASGRTDMFKGDVKTDSLLIDAKYTGNDGFSVSDSLWSTVSAWSRNEGREPVVAIRIEDDNGPVDIAVVTEQFYSERHPEFMPNDQLKRQKQKKVTRRMAGKKPTSFIVGGFRLIAYSFDAFVKDIRHEDR